MKNVWKMRFIVIGLILGFLGIFFAMLSFSLGLFRSDKEKAMKFLSEIPQEIVNSKTFSFTGVNKLSKNINEKGISSHIQINNLKFNSLKSSALKNFNLDLLTGNISIFSQFDLANKANNSLINISDGKNNLEFQLFNKDNEFYGAVPAVYSDILFKIPEKYIKNQYLFDCKYADLSSLNNESQKLFQDIFQIIGNEADVRVITGEKKGYRFDLTKTSTTKLWAKILEYLKNQKNHFSYKYQWIDNLYNDTKKLVRPTSGTFISVTKRNKNIEVSIVGEMNKKPVKIIFKKIDELKNNILKTKLIFSTFNGSDKYIDAKYEEKIQKNNMKFTSKGILKIKNQKINSITTSGFLKDRKVGEFITFSLNDVTIDSKEDNIINFSAMLRLGLLEGNVKTKDDMNYSLNIDLSKIPSEVQKGYVDLLKKYAENNLSLNNGVMYDE